MKQLAVPSFTVFREPRSGPDPLLSGNTHAPVRGRPSRTVRAAGDSQTVLGPVLPSLGKRWPSRKSCHCRVTISLFREPVRASSLTAAARTLPSCLASALPSRRISFRTGTARVRVAGTAGCSGRDCCLPDDSQAFWHLAGSPTGQAPPGLRRTGSTGARRPVPNVRARDRAEGKTGRKFLHKP